MKTVKTHIDWILIEGPSDLEVQDYRSTLFSMHYPSDPLKDFVFAGQAVHEDYPEIRFQINSDLTGEVIKWDGEQYGNPERHVIAYTDWPRPCQIRGENGRRS